MSSGSARHGRRNLGRDAGERLSQLWSRILVVGDLPCTPGTATAVVTASASQVLGVCHRDVALEPFRESVIPAALLPE